MPKKCHNSFVRYRIEDPYKDINIETYINNDSIVLTNLGLIELKNKRKHCRDIIKVWKNSITTTEREFKSKIMNEKKKEQQLSRDKKAAKKEFSYAKYLEEKMECDINKYKRSIEYYTNTIIPRLNEIIRGLDNHLKNITNKCQQCRKKFMNVLDSKCTYNHLICLDCIEKNGGDCPICKQEIPCCAICMTYEHSLVDINCGNGHEVCIQCMEKIYATKNKCPFCRVELTH